MGWICSSHIYDTILNQINIPTSTCLEIYDSTSLVDNYDIVIQYVQLYLYSCLLHTLIHPYNFWSALPNITYKKAWNIIKSEKRFFAFYLPNCENPYSVWRTLKINVLSVLFILVKATECPDKKWILIMYIITFAIFDWNSLP